MMLAEGFQPEATPDAGRRADVLLRLRRLAEARGDGLADALAALALPEAQWRAAHPLNVVDGDAAAQAAIWGPLVQALPDLERRDTVFVGGTYQGRTYLAAVGHYCGTWRRDWLGIPATGKTLYLRYGEVWQIGPDGRVVQANLLWDVLDAMRQAGVWPLAPSLGVEGMWPGPLTADGVRLVPSNGEEGRASLDQTLQMHRTLAEHDDRANLSRDSLIAMPQRDHWHPRMMWYGLGRHRHDTGAGRVRGRPPATVPHRLPPPPGDVRGGDGRAQSPRRGPLHPHRRRPLFRDRGVAVGLCDAPGRGGSAVCRPRAAPCSCG
jgi:hypothetical protein